jgi:hypothetical protein
LISIFKNIEKFNDHDFINLFQNTLKKYLESNFTKENYDFRDKVFFSIVEDISKNRLEEKYYLILIKDFIKKNIMINEVYLENNIHNPNRNLEKVFLYLENINYIFEINNDKNFMTDFILYLNKYIFNINEISNENSFQNIQMNSINFNNILNLNNSREFSGPSGIGKI